MIEDPDYARFLAGLAANDAAHIIQPRFEDLYVAYVAGAEAARKHPDADTHIFHRSADAYCKLFHATKDPESFAAQSAES